MLRDYFSSKLAKGGQFCNRQDEQKELRDNITQGRHTVMVSPRRYGKSSLVHKVVEEIGLPAAYIDLFLAHDDQAVTARILNGVAILLSQIMPITQKAASALQKYFSHIKVGLVAGGFSLQGAHDTQVISNVEQIYETLKTLNEVLSKEGKQAIIFIDEFQDIQNAESARSIQGAIRNIAQSTDHLVFIFSGSSRHLLLQLFDDKTMPFYMLCDKILLDRIASKDYIPYIQRAAKQQWKSELSDDAIRRFMALTELHPFYVNFLGKQLFKNTKLPDEKQVSEAWDICLENEKRRLILEVGNLTLNQQKVLKALAGYPTEEVYGHQFLSTASISISSMKSCIQFLQDKDLIYKVTLEDVLVEHLKKGQYSVLDPLLAFYLRQYR